eukprot:PITA_32576
MVIKLDLANAFDSVRHEFLFSVMEIFGFSKALINWVKTCIASPWIVPLVNGQSTEFFQASRGIRQGLPLSLLLYTIQASVLSFQLDYFQQIQTLSGLRMAHNVKDINHAQFADDTLLLGGASINSDRSFKKEIPGNGKKIRIWEDSILGNQPLNQVEDLVNIIVWLQARNLKTLWDISNWTDEAGSLWDGWNLGEVPQWLDVEATLLLDLIQGKSPLKASSKDKRGWGSLLGSYSIAKGYKSMMVVPNIPPEPTQWKFILSFTSLPKIDFFRWTLAHKGILTRDNLRMHGMEGPSRFPLCVSDEETANHLLLTCPFAQEVWRVS